MARRRDTAPRPTGARARGLRIGIISDTHGLIRPEALDALRGSDHIVHAGDIGSPAVLTALRGLAPVTAVRGNNDRGDWARGLAETEAVEVGGVWLYVLHDVHALDLDPLAGGFAAVIAGHSHRPLVEQRRGTLFVNPGSARQRPAAPARAASPCQSRWRGCR